jgi:hypothetical protein
MLRVKLITHQYVRDNKFFVVILKVSHILMSIELVVVEMIKQVFSWLLK